MKRTLGKRGKTNFTWDRGGGGLDRRWITINYYFLNSIMKFYISFYQNSQYNV